MLIEKTKTFACRSYLEEAIWSCKHACLKWNAAPVSLRFDREWHDFPARTLFLARCEATGCALRLEFVTAGDELTFLLFHISRCSFFGEHDFAALPGIDFLRRQFQAVE